MNPAWLEGLQFLRCTAKEKKINDKKCWHDAKATSALALAPCRSHLKPRRALDRAHPADEEADRGPASTAAT